MEAAILDAKKRGDSLGGYLRLYVDGIPARSRRAGVRQARRACSRRPS